jgi:hypothetical protein
VLFLFYLKVNTKIMNQNALETLELRHLLAAESSENFFLLTIVNSVADFAVSHPGVSVHAINTAILRMMAYALESTTFSDNVFLMSWSATVSTALTSVALSADLGCHTYNKLAEIGHSIPASALGSTAISIVAIPYAFKLTFELI